MTDPDLLTDAGWTELKVTVTNAGGGPYLVIETDRWAMDEPAELTAILEKVKKRCFKLFETDSFDILPALKDGVSRGKSG